MVQKGFMVVGATVVLLVSNHHGPAQAACVTKSAVATAPTANAARWFAMETIVQQVSWGLWPGWVANGNIAGHKVTKKRYKCKPDAGATTCHARATICSVK